MLGVIGQKVLFEIASKPPGPLLGPPFHHHFGLRKKLDRVPSLPMQVAKEAFSSPAKRKESHRRRHPNVNSDVPYFRFIAEFAGARSTASEKTGHVSIRTGIHKVDRVFHG